MNDTRKAIIELIEPGEEFRDCHGYEELYLVSNFARIMSLGNGKSNNSKPKILKIGKRKQYGKIMLYKNSETREFAVHRLVANAFLGLNLEDTKTLVLHRFEDLDSRGMIDNSLDNIFLGTHKDNTQDMLSKGRNKLPRKGKFGTEHNKTKKIYQYDMNGYFIKEWDGAYEILRNLGFHPGNIYKACNGLRKTAYYYKWSYLIKHQNEF